MNNKIKSPFAKYSGVLDLGNTPVECYVLDTLKRVISLRAVLKAIANIEGGVVEDYIGVKALKPYINKRLIVEENISFTIPGNPKAGKGITSDNFLKICRAYVSALSDGKLKTETQKNIAIRCSIILSACAEVGLIALIDEATGYQHARGENALQVTLNTFIAEEMQAWEKVFPDELWEEFGRLTNWQGPLHSRPKYWGKLVTQIIYNTLSPEIANYLKHNRPSRSGKHHQWFTRDVGLKSLIPHIWQIIGIAKTCDTIEELREQANYQFGDGKLQMRMNF
ncbi:P63C domain-containing protein [Desulfonema magnum]|uniref:P63C domain-containing protein n=1 Tax=Desulfonema magnum TaxID=45655 RepID=A0A975BPK2_9BACT|nr:P63C domain-containing protein [Desulfonema magnum]QTA88824.1 P63C domain-containing protein [Desulfonema magnum]